MEKLKIKNQNKYKEGDIIFVQGFSFKASNIKFKCINSFGDDVFNFTGTCTDDKRNDPIKNTGYNGGTYTFEIKS